MNLDKVYFLDIETIPATRLLSEAPQHMQKCFKKKFEKFVQFEEGPKGLPILVDDYEVVWKEKAALNPEFSRIACVSFGVVLKDGSIKVTCEIDQDELKILDRIVKVCDSNPRLLVAHNGKGFDYPYIVKRLIIHGINVPSILRIIGKRPWEMPRLIDTQEMWAMGVFNAHVSLDTLAMIFGIPSPKAKMSGAYVAEEWYSGEGTMEDRMKRIAEYCDTDVNVLASVYIQMMNYAG